MHKNAQRHKRQLQENQTGMNEGVKGRSYCKNTMSELKAVLKKPLPALTQAERRRRH